MFTLRILNKDTMPLPINGPLHRFRAVYEECQNDKKSDLNELLEIMDPAFDHWVNMLKDPSYPKDINYVSLIGLLTYHFDDPIQRVNEIVNYLNNEDNIKQYIQCLFIERIRKSKRVYQTNQDIMFLFLVALELKLAIKKSFEKIDNILRKKQAESIYAKQRNLIYELEEIDFYFLKHTLEEGWEDYFFYLFSTELTNKDLIDLTKLRRGIIFREVLKIWHLLKQNW